MKTEAELTRETQKSAQTEPETPTPTPTPTRSDSGAREGEGVLWRTQPILPSLEVVMLGFSPSTDTAPRHSGVVGFGTGGGRKVNQRQNLPSEATYAQCGRQHFHPTFAVAISAGSMISAWPKEQRHHPERKGRVTNVHPKRTNHPSGRSGEIRQRISILWPLRMSSTVGGGHRKEAWGPRQVRGLPGFPQTLTHRAESGGVSPCLGLLPRRQAWVSQGSPCWGQSTHGDGGPALPSPGQLVPTGQEEGSVWAEASWQVLSKCWG